MKREEFLLLEEAKRVEAGNKKMPPCIVRQDSRLQHAISSLSSSSGSSTNQGGMTSSSGEEMHGHRHHHPHSHSHHHHQSSSSKKKQPKLGLNMTGAPSSKPHGGGTTSFSDQSSDNNKKSGSGKAGGPTQVSSSSSGGSSDNSNNDKKAQNVSSNSSNKQQDFHDYHAKPLPDPKLADSERSSNSSGADEDSSGGGGNEADADDNAQVRISNDSSTSGDDDSGEGKQPDNMRVAAAHKKRHAAATDDAGAPEAPSSSSGFRPPKIAKKGGIAYDVSAVCSSLSPTTTTTTPSILGKHPVSNDDGIKNSNNATIVVGAARVPDNDNRAPPPTVTTGRPQSDGSSSADPETSSGSVTPPVKKKARSSSHQSIPLIRASYHVNEDDMILMDDVLMCPFTFRSHDAVLCGSLAECVMPGMLRANFSERNKLASLELVYDAMGFMQQLERASGNEGSAQIIPGSLELALSPTSSDARVITTAKAPFPIVNVNDIWTQLTGYTQMEVEGREYVSLLDGEATVKEAYQRAGKPKYDLGDIALGRPACTTNIHYDKDGNDFIEFVCSYPLTNDNGEVTHLLHVSKELPSFHGMLPPSPPVPAGMVAATG